MSQMSRFCVAEGYL